MIQASFCFHCGRKVSPTVKSCWFCGSPTERAVRPPRLCPYCHEKVHVKAVKCPHCSEFLDGRGEAKPAPTPQMIFMMEQMARSGQIKALEAAQAAARLGAPGGAPGLDAPRQPGLPAPPRAALPAPGQATVPPPAPKSLPAPRAAAQDSFIDVEVSAEAMKSAANVSGAKVGANLPAVRGAAAPPARPGNLPAKSGDGMFAGGKPNLPAIRSGAKEAAAKGLPVVARILRKIFTRKKPVDPVVEAQIANPEDRYRVCTNCSTEVLATDNFCYNCGQQFRQSPYPQSAPPAPPASNLLIYFLALVGMAVAFLGPKFHLEGPLAANLDIAMKIGAVGAPVLTAWAFMRKTGFFGRLIGFILFLVSLVIAFVTFF